MHEQRSDGLEVATCRDRESGLDQILVKRVHWGSAGGSTAVMYGAKPGKDDIEVVYQTGFYDETNARHVLIDAEGNCRWRMVERAEQALGLALAGLMDGAAEGIGYGIRVGETAQLRTRRVDGKTVRDAIAAIHEFNRTQPADWAEDSQAEAESGDFDGDPTPGRTTLLAVDVEGARFATDEDAASWLVVRIHRIKACDLPGIVLLQDKRSGEWRSIYELPRGARCEGLTVRETMRDGYVRDDKLYAEVCLAACESSRRGHSSWGWFEINLRQDTVAPLSSRPDFVPIIEGPAERPAALDLAAIALGGSNAKRAGP